MADIFRMHVVAAGHGDCLWIEYGDAQSPQRILVDAGTVGTSKRVKLKLDAVRGASPSHELFLVTHIDADHIGGALALLKDAQTAAQFKEIWFNGRSHLEAAKKMEPFGAVQGEKLSKSILDNGVAWNTSVGNAPLMREVGKTLISCPMGAAVVTVLTPTAKELVVLSGKWDEEIKKAGLAPDVKAEVQAKKTVSGIEAFGGVDVAGLAQEAVPEDAAPANGSSVSTLVEFKGKRMLLGADAHPSVLLAGVRQLQPEGRLKVDVFKLPHHGSSANVTSALLDAIDTDVVVFSSNGAYFQHPDQAAVARVLVRYKEQGVRLVFNYRSDFNKMWDSDSLRRDWNYTSTFGTGQEGVMLELL